MCLPSKEGSWAEGPSSGQDLSTHPQRTASCLRMGFVACFLRNKLSKYIHLELSKHPVLNSNNVIQKLNQDASLLERACLTKTKEKISWKLGGDTFLCSTSILMKLDFFQRKNCFRGCISTISTGTQLK